MSKTNLYMNYQYDKLLLRQTKSKSHAEIYLADDELVLESNLGRLFMIVEIFSKEKKMSALIEKIIASIEADYYNSPTPDVESSLETTCENFNQNLPDLVFNPEMFIKKINILTGVIKDNQIFLSSFGRFKTMLLRNKKMINIIPVEDREKNDEKEKIFSNLISGEIKEKDIFLFSNLNLFDYFSLVKIKKTLETLNPEQAAEYFKNLLLENLNPTCFATIVFKFEASFENKEIDEKKYLKEFYTTQESMDNLTNIERKTARVLTANIVPSLKKTFEKIKKTKLPKEKKLSLPETIIAPPTIKILKSKKNKNYIKNFKKKITDIYNLLVNLPKKSAEQIKKINPKTIRISVIISILIIVFISSLYAMGIKQKNKKIDDNFLSKSAEIEEKIENAKAVLIYQDEEAATLILKEAKILLNALPQDKPLWSEKHNELESQIKTTLNQAFHIFEPEANFLLDLEKINVLKIKKIIRNQNHLFALSEEGLLYEINPQEKSYTINNEDFNFIEMKNWDNHNLIFLSTENKFTTYNLPEKTKNEKLLNLKNNLITDFAPYNDKLYVLDAEKKQILKISRPLSQAPEISEWYNDDKNLLKNVKKIIIDGDIWVSTLEGKIYRFYKGKNQNFEIKKLNKDLGQEIEIYTETDWNKLYVLDKQNFRIVILNKSGMVEKQFLNEELKNAENLIINNSQDKAWFNIGGRILEIEL